MSYTLSLPRSVQKQLARLDTVGAGRIEKALVQLEANPRPAGAKKFKGRAGWRIRVGDYRD